MFGADWQNNPTIQMLPNRSLPCPHTHTHTHTHTLECIVWTLDNGILLISWHTFPTLTPFYLDVAPRDHLGPCPNRFLGSFLWRESICSKTSQKSSLPAWFDSLPPASSDLWPSSASGRLPGFLSSLTPLRLYTPVSLNPWSSPQSLSCLLLLGWYTNHSLFYYLVDE